MGSYVAKFFQIPSGERCTGFLRGKMLTSSIRLKQLKNKYFYRNKKFLYSLWCSEGYSSQSLGNIRKKNNAKGENLATFPAKNLYIELVTGKEFSNKFLHAFLKFLKNREALLPNPNTAIFYTSC